MYSDAITLEQLRVFITVVEEGSFSAAAKKLHRAQSAISYSISNFQELLEIALFDRSFRKPRLTENGHKILGKAKEVLGQMIQFQEKARKIVCQEETDIYLAVDIVFPPKLLAEMCAKFQKEFPNIRLHLRTVFLNEVSELVLSGDFDLGIFAPLNEKYPTLIQKVIYPLQIFNVASKDHPLAESKEPLQRKDVEKHMQIVVSNSPAKELKKTVNVFAKETWRVASFATKKELILAGVGWGSLPSYMVHEEIRKGSLVELSVDDSLLSSITGFLFVIRQQEMILGEGGRWIWSYLVGLQENLNERVEV